MNTDPVWLAGGVHTDPIELCRACSMHPASRPGTQVHDAAVYKPKHRAEPVHQDYADYIYGAFTERIMETCKKAGVSVAEVGTPWNHSLGEPMHEHVWVWINKAGRALSDIQICFLCGQERLMGMTDGLEIEEVKDGIEGTPEASP